MSAQKKVALQSSTYMVGHIGKHFIGCHTTFYRHVHMNFEQSRVGIGVVLYLVYLSFVFRLFFVSYSASKTISKLAQLVGLIIIN